MRVQQMGETGLRFPSLFCNLSVVSAAGVACRRMHMVTHTLVSDAGNRMQQY
jgi:hypothetical protein